jgi:carbon-monoxide dehydrogenase medium subunit
VEEGFVRWAGSALAAVGAGLWGRDAEGALFGRERSVLFFAQAAARAAEACEPVTDQRGSKAYKRHVAGVLTQRALRRACERTRRV